jgi:hypothetical protein
MDYYFPHLTSLSSGFFLLLAAVLYQTYRLWNRISIAKVPGPESKSWLYGTQFACCIVLLSWSVNTRQYHGAPPRSGGRGMRLHYRTYCRITQAFGQKDFQWQSTYGNVVRLRGPIGVIIFCDVPSLSDDLSSSKTISWSPIRKHCTIYSNRHPTILSSMLNACVWPESSLAVWGWPVSKVGRNIEFITSRSEAP